MSDPFSTLSITFPVGWRSQALTDGDWSQVGLFAEQPHDISILVASRPLTASEAARETTELLDWMIEQTMINTATLGNEIVQVGRVEPLIEEWPAFAAVATSRDRSKMITILRSVVRDRVYVLSTLTDNLQGSPELGARISEVVGSLEIHDR